MTIHFYKRKKNVKKNAFEVIPLIEFVEQKRLSSFVFGCERAMIFGNEQGTNSVG